MKIIFAATLAVFLTACSDGAIISASNAFNEGLYNKAISKALHAQSQHEYTDIQKAELDYIVAESYRKLKETEKSTVMYRYIVETYPETRFALPSQSVLNTVQP